jgi:hypothetical protein
MLNEKIPKNKYWATDYPKLDPRAEGTPILLLWGHKHNIVPTCIDTEALTYKICDQTKPGRNALLSIDELKADANLLSEGPDYSFDPEKGEFTLTGSPYLAANTTYYFVLSGTWLINGVGYLHSVASAGPEYADGILSTIDNGSPPIWTPDPGGGSLGFKVWGKQTIDGEDSIQVFFDYAELKGVNFRDVDGHTRLAQSFKTGANPFFLTRITAILVKDPQIPEFDPVGTFSIQILNAAKVQVGTISGSRDCAEVMWGAYDLPWAIRGTPSKLLAQVTAHALPGGATLDQVGYIVEDIYENVLGGSVADDLVTADFDALKVAKTKHLGIVLSTEETFNQLIETLEATELFKFLPTLDRKYTVKFAAVGDSEKAHFRDEDFQSFKVIRNWKAIFQKIKIQYDEDPENQEWQVKEYESSIADIIYHNFETLTVSTKFVSGTDAQNAAETYSRLLEYPQKTIVFDLSCGAGFSLMPMDKIKITRSRGDNTGGAFNGVYFRILEISKNIVEATATITAILDEQTW